LTSWTLVPLAARDSAGGREPSMTCGLRRSCSVIECTMPWTRSSWRGFELASACSMLGGMPGIRPISFVERTHLAHLLQLGQEILSVSVALRTLLFELGGLLGVDCFLLAFSISVSTSPMPKNALRDAIRMERFEILDAFADTDELDRFAEHGRAS
jgi:hypothetical protein